MTDVISGGPQGGRRLPTALLVVAVLVVAVVLTVRHRPHSAQHERAESPVRPGQLTVLVGGRDVRSLDIGSDRTHPIAGLPAASARAYDVTPLATGQTALALAAGSCPAGCTGANPVYVVGAAQRRARRIGPATHVAPGADDRTLWLTTGSTVREVTPSGHALAGPLRLPSGADVLRGVDGGLLLRTADGDWAVWNPRTGAVAGHYGRVLAATGNTIVWQRGRTVYDTDLTVGRSRRLTALNGAGIATAALSPDGRYLAVAVDPSPPDPHGLGPHPGPRTVAIVDTRGSTLLPLAGIAYDVTSGLGLGWFGRSGRPVLLAQAASPVTLSLWQPGTGTLRDVPASPSVLLPVAAY